MTIGAILRYWLRPVDGCLPGQLDQKLPKFVSGFTRFESQLLA